jgi:large subunit ribosomal protein L25
MTSNNATFTVQPRTILGKSVKTLRRQAQVPANIHGDLETPIAVTAETIPFTKLYSQVGDTGLVYLTVGDEKTARPVLIDEVALNPVTQAVAHVVFKQVSLKEKVTAAVPIEFVGEVNVPESVLMYVRDEIEVEALPTDFPDKIEVDISVLTEIGQSILIADLNYDKTKVKLMIEDEDLDKPVVLLQAQRAEEVEEEVEPTGAEAADAEAESTEPAESEEAATE